MSARVLLAVAGAGLVAAAFAVARVLAAEAWSPGAVGFWLVVALPGLLLLAKTSTLVEPQRLAPLLPFAFVLLGLDVTDSARRSVAISGYVVATVAWLAVLATLVALCRRARPATWS